MSDERGSATVVVMTLLVVLTMYAVSNAMVIHHLRAELKYIEQRQLQQR